MSAEVFVAAWTLGILVLVAGFPNMNNISDHFTGGASLLFAFRTSNVGCTFGVIRGAVAGWTIGEMLQQIFFILSTAAALV